MAGEAHGDARRASVVRREAAARPPLAPRGDVIAAALLALVSCAMVPLSQATGFSLQAAPAWVALLASIALAAPLVVRRRRPVPVAVVQAVVYIVAGELGAMELYASQVMLFLGFYSIGAWEPRRRLALWARTAIATVMAAWLVSGAVRGFFDPETGERGVSAYLAFLIIQIVINLGYFGGAWVFGDRAWRQRIEREQLAAAHDEIRAQQGRLAEQAVSLERVRIARELHDVVAHHVSAMGIQAGAARRLLGRDEDAAADALRGVERSAREAIGELRSLVVTLRSEDDGTGAAPDLDELDELVAAAVSAGQRVTLAHIGTPRTVSAAVGLTGYRVVQEALTNARKHAGPAASVDVRVRWLPEAVEVEVGDDGHGVGAGDRAAAGASGGSGAGVAGGGTGMGVAGMRERVTALGGALEAGPKSRGGYLVRATLPTASAD